MVNVGMEITAALKVQMQQMGRILNELDSIHFTQKSRILVKEIRRRVETNKRIMALLFLVVVGVIAEDIFKLVNPNNKDILNILELALTVRAEKLIWNSS